MAMTGAGMWALRKQYKAAVAAYQGSDPAQAQAYADALGVADSQAIIDYEKANAVITVTSVSGVTPGSGVSGPGAGTIA